MPKPRILVIDDDPMITQLLQEHLSNEGCVVETLHMAEQGFLRATKAPPDLIFLDVMLPDSTGFQMLGRLRGDPATKAIPVIMMSGTARNPNQKEIGQRMGADDYVLKPFDVLEVGERVKKLLQGKVIFEKKSPPPVLEPEPEPFVQPEPYFEPPAPAEPEFTPEPALTFSNIDSLMPPQDPEPMREETWSPPDFIPPLDQSHTPPPAEMLRPPEPRYIPITPSPSLAKTGPEDLLPAHLQKITNRVTAGIILAAIINGAAMLMRINTPFKIWGYPGFAMICFCGGLVGALILLVAIWRGRKQF